MKSIRITELKPLNELFEEKRKELISDIKEMVDREMKLFEFEIAYSLFVPRKVRERTAKLVEKTRKDLWKKALKKAKGDIKKAISFYSA